MQQIWVVTKDEEIAASVNTELRNNDGCSVSVLKDLDRNCHCQATTRPAALIIDLETIDIRSGDILRDFKSSYPDVAQVGLAPTDGNSTIDPILQHEFDEVIPRPPGRKQMDRMVSHLRESLASLDRFFHLRNKLLKEMRESQIIARSKPMRDIMRRLPKLSASMSWVLIQGETGTGKELFARAIHYLGPRAGKPFITVDCGALPENLVENELFGHVRGAYTDAGSCSEGLIREAHGGTLFLDEIEALPLSIQPKLLRFLQERQFKPLGQSTYVPVDVQVLAATNTDLMEAVRQKGFRADLYYRLNVVPLSIPPLRERRHDIPALAYHFIQKHAKGDPQSQTEIPPAIIQLWLNQNWPGNVRELENRVQEWLLCGNTDETRSISVGTLSSSETIRPLAEVREEVLARCDRLYLKSILIHTQGNLSAAARLAKMNRKSLRRLLHKYGIKKPEGY